MVLLVFGGCSGKISGCASCKKWNKKYFRHALCDCIGLIDFWELQIKVTVVYVLHEGAAILCAVPVVDTNAHTNVNNDDFYL